MSRQPAAPIRGFSAELADKGSKWVWVIKDRDGVTIARSPKRYSDIEEAREALERFTRAIG